MVLIKMFCSRVAIFFFLPAYKVKRCYRLLTEEPMSSGKKSKQRMKT